MGQRAIGILYGCECPKGLDLHGEDGPEPDYEGVLGRWEKRYPPKRDKPQIRAEGEGDRMLVGVWVAVGGSGEDGAPYLGEKCIPLDEFAVAYKTQIAKASKLWARFAAYVRERESVELPSPRLWLTPCETA